MERKKLFKKIKQGLRKNYSMKFRFLATVIVAMFSVTIFVGGLSIYEVDKYIQGQAKDFVSVTCTNESSKINSSLRNMEKSVKIMESYLMDFFTSEAQIKDPSWQKEVIKNADQMFVDVAQHTSTSGAVAYYFRFNPSISDPKAGLFYSKEKGSDKFVPFEVTDISLYDKDDTEHVGWYWQPYEAGEPIWMEPYHNQNNDIVMISYVIPMYFGDTFIGVVGMDFDYMVLADQVHNIKVYENGFAHLKTEKGVICSDVHDHEEKADEDSGKYLQVSNDLLNGMTLVVSASYDDIWQIRYEISFKILLIVLILSALFTFIAILLVRRIVNPLKALTDASIKLSNGDYNVEIAPSDTYEIKLLSTAFENMTKSLKEREDLLKLSANYDSMTGLRNTTSYTAWATTFDREIESENADFGVMVLDLNDLKKANDEYGHAVGNALIITAAKIISDVFKRSPVFRIGGDEFLVVLRDNDLENCDRLFNELDIRCANTFVQENETLPVSLAKGFIRFDAAKDSCFADVFKRADDAMYENKRKMKTA